MKILYSGKGSTLHQSQKWGQVYLYSLHWEDVCWVGFRKDSAFIRLRQPTSQTSTIAARTNWIFYEELPLATFFSRSSNVINLIWSWRSCCAAIITSAAPREMLIRVMIRVCRGLPPATSSTSHLSETKKCFFGNNYLRINWECNTQETTTNIQLWMQNSHWGKRRLNNAREPEHVVDGKGLLFIWYGKN